MLSWLIIGILLIAGLIAIKLNHFKHRIFIILLISVALFLYLSMTLVYNKNDLDFTTANGVVDAVGVYFGWLANGFDNLKSITGKAIEMDWTASDRGLINKTTDEIIKKR